MLLTELIKVWVVLGKNFRNFFKAGKKKKNERRVLVSY